MHFDKQENFIFGCNRALLHSGEEIQKYGSIGKMPTCQFTDYEGMRNGEIAIHKAIKVYGQTSLMVYPD